MLLEELAGGHPELLEDDLELLLLLETELPLFKPELFFLLSDWLLGFMYLLDLSALLELAAEGSIAPVDFGGELLKADNVFSNFLVIMHFEPFKLIFSISFDVERTKVGPEFGNEFVVIVRPGGVGVRVHERRFKVVECCPLEEGEHVVDLVCVKLKCVGSVAEVEL